MNTQPKHLLRRAVLALSLLGLAAAPALAHGPGGGWRGGHGGGYGGGYHHRGGGAYWVAPALIGGAILGATLARPVYAYPATPAPVYPAYVPNVVTYGTPVTPQPVGYFCPTTGQFYPYVATCNVPWQLL